MKLGDKAIINDGVHGLPNGSEISLIGMDYENEFDEIYLFESESGMMHHLHESEFKWLEEVK